MLLIGKSIKHRTDGIVTISLKECTFEGVRDQMLLKSVRQLGQSRDHMIVTHSATHSFPNVFLWVEFGSSDREVDDF